MIGPDNQQYNTLMHHPDNSNHNIPNQELAAKCVSSIPLNNSGRRRGVTRSVRICRLLVFCLMGCSVQGVLLRAESTTSALPYRNPHLKLDQRVKDLLSRMTPEEKALQLVEGWPPNEKAGDKPLEVGLMREPAYWAQTTNRLTPAEVAHLINEYQRRAVAHTRLGIPILMNEESLHGACWGDTTLFPQAIALAATWDQPLMSKVSDVIATELRAVGIRQTLAPVLNISRDPRWGRTEETYGEDPWLVAQMGLAFVGTMESNGVACMLKHFVANYSDGGQDSYPVYYSKRYLREVDLFPFEVAVREGKVQSIMAAYNSLNGVPCAMNSWLLNTVLRKDWGFQGVVCGDYGAVEGILTKHKLAIPKSDLVADYLRAGLDIDLPNSRSVLTAVQHGKVPIKLLDRSVARLLKIKFELGLFEHPYVNEKAANGEVQTPEHLAVALRAAREAIVLLKNQGNVLPLSKTRTKQVVIIGPSKMPMGNYYGTLGGEWNGHEISMQEGIERVAPGCQVVHLKRYDHLGKLPPNPSVVIVVATIHEGEFADRAHLALPAAQQQLILELAKQKLPTIVVLCTGAPVTMSAWLDKVPAVLQSWYLGQEGGRALAEVLFGNYCPGGRLPMTFPQCVGQEPMYYSFRPGGRNQNDYADNNGKPQFPFGFGLSYTTFRYSNARASASLISTTGTVEVSVDVQNTGTRVGDEVVQLYTHEALPYMSVPLEQLRGFKRVHLAPGEKKTVSFLLNTAELSVWNLHMKRTVEPGTLEVMLGRSSADIVKTLKIQIVK